MSNRQIILCRRMGSLDFFSHVAAFSDKRLLICMNTNKQKGCTHDSFFAIFIRQDRIERLMKMKCGYPLTVAVYSFDCVVAA